MTYVKLVLSPLSFVGYPHHTVPLLCALLKKKGYSVEVEELNIDFMNLIFPHLDEKKTDVHFLKSVGDYMDFEQNNDSLMKDLNSSKKFFEHSIKKILEGNPKIVCFVFENYRSSTQTLEWIINVFKELKKRKDIFTVIGGSMITSLNRGTISQIMKEKEQVDCVIFGEIEEVLPNVVKKLQENESLDDVDGLSFRTASRKVVLKEFTYLKNLDELPIPDYSCMKMEDYLNFRIGSRIFSIIGSRGCPYRCVFCEEKNIYGPFRSRSNERIIEEMVFLRKRYGIKIFRFADELMNLDIKKLVEFSTSLKKIKNDFVWGGMCRLNKGMNYKIFKKMYEGNCRFLWFGLESASADILKKMKKDIDLNYVENILRDCHRAGIFTLIFIISNFPGETPNDTLATVNFLRRNHELLDGIHVLKFFLPISSDMASELEKYGIKKARPSPKTLVVLVQDNKNNFKNYHIIQKVRNELAQASPASKDFLDGIYAIDQKYKIITEI